MEDNKGFYRPYWVYYRYYYTSLYIIISYHCMFYLYDYINLMFYYDLYITCCQNLILLMPLCVIQEVLSQGWQWVATCASRHAPTVHGQGIWGAAGKLLGYEGAGSRVMGYGGHLNHKPLDSHTNTNLKFLHSQHDGNNGLPNVWRLQLILTCCFYIV